MNYKIVNGIYILTADPPQPEPKKETPLDPIEPTEPEPLEVQSEVPQDTSNDCDEQEDYPQQERRTRHITLRIPIVILEKLKQEGNLSRAIIKRLRGSFK